MSKTEHTRWTFEAEETSSGMMFSVYDDDDWRITDVSVSEDQARLIAAAPEMLAFVKQCRKHVNAVIECEAATDWLMWRADIDALLSRATGQAGEG